MPSSKTLSTLDLLPVGSSAIIRNYASSIIAAKMIEMGFLPGKKAMVISKAPFGGPMSVQIQSSLVSMRLDEARTIEIETEP